MAAIYLIRHGQASFGAADYDRLSERGIEQSRALGRTLSDAGVQVGRVMYGDMLRHRQTAQHVLEALNDSVACETDPDWNEYDHRAVIAAHCPDYAEPDRLRQAMQQHPDPRRAFQDMFEAAVTRWMSGRHDDDYRETWSAFCARCNRALQTLLVRQQATGGSVLVFTSGGPIAAVVKDLLGLSDARSAALSWSLVNCGITKLIVGKRGVRLATLNGHAHFEGHHAGLLTYR
jgi:broad specificity phosphatase PhoE